MNKRCLKRLICEKSSNSIQEVIVGGEQKLKDGVILTRKTILLLGDSGCGKGTLIDGFANYLYDVKEDDDFRYTIFPVSGQIGYLQAFEMIRKWYLSEYYCPVEDFEIWYLMKATESSISYDVWQVLNSVVREIDFEFVRVLPLITHATKREPRIALTSLARIGYVGLRENEDYYTFNMLSVLNTDPSVQFQKALSFADNYKHMQQILKSLDKHFRWVSISDGRNCVTSVQLNLNRDSSYPTKFYTTGSFRRSCRAKQSLVKNKPAVIQEENTEISDESSVENSTNRTKRYPVIKNKMRKEAPHMVMPKMEINIPSRFVKEHHVEEEYEIIRYRRAKVKDSCIQINDKTLRFPEPGMVKKRDLGLQTEEETPEYKDECLQVIEDCKSEFTETVQCNTNESIQTEFFQKSVATEIEIKMALAYTQTDYAEKASCTQTNIDMADVCMQTNMDFYFKPIREHGISNDHILTIGGTSKQTNNPGVNIEAPASLSVDKIITNVENPSVGSESDVPQLLEFSSNFETEQQTVFKATCSSSSANGTKPREINPIILTSFSELRYNDKSYKESDVRQKKEHADTPNLQLLQEITNPEVIKKERQYEDNYALDQNKQLHNISYSSSNDFSSEYKLDRNSPKKSPRRRSRELHNCSISPEVVSIVSRSGSISQSRELHEAVSSSSISINNQQKRLLVETGIATPVITKSEQSEEFLTKMYKPGITLIQWSGDNEISLYEEHDPFIEKERPNAIFNTLV